MPWWVDFEGRASACVESYDGEDAARKLAEELGGAPVKQIRPLPYPANPRLNSIHHGAYGPCPSFCYSPTICAGRGSCPKSYACSE